MLSRLMLDRLEQVTIFRVPHWKYKSVHVVSGKLTFAMCGGGHCLNVLVRVELHIVGGCFLSVSACFSLHDSSESVEVCSKAPPLAAMGDVLRPVPSFPHRPPQHTTKVNFFCKYHNSDFREEYEKKTIEGKMALGN